MRYRETSGITSSDDCIHILKNEGYQNFKKLSSKRFAVLHDEDRINFLVKALSLFPDAAFVESTKISSIGHVLINSRVIMLSKLFEKQGTKSAGIENELRLVNNIKNHLKLNKILDIKFFSGNEIFLIKDVTGVTHSGKKTKKRSKSDIIIKTKSGNVPISVKMSSAENWESADSYYKDKANKIIKSLYDDKKIAVYDYKDVKRITKSIGIRATPEEIKDVIFGDDILGKGAVIKQTFFKQHFEYIENKNLLMIYSELIIRTPSDVPSELEPWFLIRNDSTRRALMFRGIRVLATYKSRINKNVLIYK